VLLSKNSRQEILSCHVLETITTIRTVRLAETHRREDNMEENKKVVIELQNVKRYFQVGSETVKALRGVSFKIYEGEFVTIQGTSGS
jgi:ABC-type glutathione transport system ATPase component